MNRLALFGFAILLLTACAGTTEPDDLIRTPAEALRVAKQVCGPGNIPGVHGHWKTRLQVGVWQTGFYVSSDKNECPMISASIRAHDGFVWDGSDYVDPGHAGCVFCANDRR